MQWDANQPSPPVDTAQGDETSWRAEEKTFIHVSEMKDPLRSDVEFSLAVDDDTSDEEHVDTKTRSDIDLWMENTSREMNAATKDISNVDLLGDLSDAEVPPVKEGASLVGERSTELDWSSMLPVELQKFINSESTTLDDECYGIFVGIACPDDMVIVPQVGTFERKKNFEALGTIQMIEKMLAQSTHTYHSC